MKGSHKKNVARIEIAKKLGITVERVRQIERCALAKLMHPRNRKSWDDIRDTLALIEQIRAQNASN